MSVFRVLFRWAWVDDKEEDSVNLFKGSYIPALSGTEGLPVC